MSDSNECSCPETGEFSWNELVTGDPAASAEFYAKLFGWAAVPHTPKGAPAGGPPYWLFKIGEQMIGGMVKPPMDSPTVWIPYVVVEDAGASLATASDNGAMVILPVTSIGEVGRIAVLRDPQGALIGLHELPK